MDNIKVAQDERVVITIPNDFISDPVKPIENEKTGMQKRINVPDHGSTLYPAKWIHEVEGNKEFSTISVKPDHYFVFQKRTNVTDENGKTVYSKEQITASALADIVKEKAEYVGYNIPASWVHDTKNPDYKTVSFLDAEKGYVSVTVASKFIMPSKFDNQEVHFSFPRVSTKEGNEPNTPYTVDISFKDENNNDEYVHENISTAELKNMLNESKKAQSAFRSVSLDSDKVRKVEIDGHKPFFSVRYSNDGKSLEAVLPEWAVKIKDGIAKISMPAKKEDGSEFTVSVSASELQNGDWVDLGKQDINFVSEFIPQISGYLQRQAERAEKQLNAQTQSNTVTNTEGFSNADSESPFIDGPSPAEEEENSVMHRGVHR